MRARCLLLAALLVPLLVGAEMPIRLVGNSAGKIAITEFPAILEEEEITRQLTSGLTTSFVFRAEVKSESLVGGARVDVRYELWDEVFQVVAVGIDELGERQTLPDIAALKSWWSELSLTVIEREGESATGKDLRLTLDVVPFSLSEQDDTQRWFSRSFAASQGGASSRIGDAGERSGSSLEKVLGVLMATSIQRSALSTYRWTKSVPRSGAE
ncbi:MAG: hypothetical protein GY906_14500 [bacterium]|nr:hypothetical protein [bacterium]